MANTANPATIPSGFTIADLKTININDEPRIAQAMIAARLETRPQEIARLIERNRTELEGYGDICVTVTQNTDPKGRGRPGQEYWLNEGQALVICALSRTPVAASIRRQVIQVYMEWRCRQNVPLIRDGQGQRLILSEPEIMAVLSFRTLVERGIRVGLDAAVQGEMERRVGAEIARLRQRITGVVIGALDSAILARLDDPAPDPVPDDGLQRFVDEMLIADAAGSVTGADLYRAYRRWAEPGAVVISATRFGRRMAARYPKIKSGCVRYQGVRLRL